MLRTSRGSPRFRLLCDGLAEHLPAPGRRMLRDRRMFRGSGAASCAETPITLWARSSGARTPHAALGTSLAGLGRSVAGRGARSPGWLRNIELGQARCGASTGLRPSDAPHQPRLTPVSAPLRRSCGASAGPRPSDAPHPPKVPQRLRPSRRIFRGWSAVSGSSGPRRRLLRMIRPPLRSGCSRLAALRPARGLLALVLGSSHLRHRMFRPAPGLLHPALASSHLRDRVLRPALSSRPAPSGRLPRPAAPRRRVFRRGAVGCEVHAGARWDRAERVAASRRPSDLNRIMPA